MSNIAPCKGEPSKTEALPENQCLTPLRHPATTSHHASPRRGPTLSTSTSSFEALDTHDPQLNQLASKLFNKTSEWITGELNSTSEDYKLLEQMNRLTTTKYSDMRQIASNVGKGISELNGKYRDLLPFLEQIDQIDESVTRLEQAAYKLDAYSKRLEAKFKTLEKISN